MIRKHEAIIRFFSFIAGIVSLYLWWGDLHCEGFRILRVPGVVIPMFMFYLMLAALFFSVAFLWERE